MRLLGNNILVLRDNSETKTESGIIIPDQSVKKKNVGTIMHVGPGTDNKKMELKAGERIAFNPHAGTEVDYEGAKHLIMKDTEVQYVL